MELLEKKYSEGVLQSALEVFETMIFMTPESTTELGETPRKITDEVIALLGFTGTRTGIVAIHCPKQLAMTICANMLGMTPEEIENDDEVADSFGEIANMIGGNFKNLWVEGGNTMDLAIPSVVFGQGVILCTGTAGVSYSTKLQFDSAALHVHLWMNS